MSLQFAMRFIATKRSLTIHANTFKCRRYVIWHNHITSRGINNVIEADSIVRNCSIDISGENNKIIIGKNCNIYNVTFRIYGNNNKIVIGSDVSMNMSLIHMGDNFSRLKIGSSVSMEECAHIYVLEGKSITIGRDSMFASGITLLTSDSHPIFALETNEPVNRAKNIKIGKHVWLGQNVTCLKGVEIADSSVIGNGSLCTAGKYKAHCIYAGNPARLIKEGYRWEQQRRLER